MVSADDTAKNEVKSKTNIKEAGGVHGWLLKKAKTFMWDAKTNTLTLPQGVVLSLEEKAALEEVLGAVRDEAKEVEKRRLEQMASMQAVGVRYKQNVVKGYSLLVNGTYRELTGVVARKIHDNLQGMLMVNNRFLNGVWKVISGLTKNEPKKAKFIVKPKDRGGR